MTILRTGLHGLSGPGVVPPAAMGGGAAAMGYYQKMLGYGPLVYFPQWEGAGLVSQELINGWDGAYTGVTLGQPGIGDGNTCPWFDGVNDFNNIWTAALAAGFDGGEGTMAIWARVNAVGVWTDGATHFAMRLDADASNRVDIFKASTNNRLDWRYTAGGVNLMRSRIGETTTDWMHLAITWSASANEVRAYFNGAQEGAPMVGLGVWAGALLNTQTIIGAGNTTPASVWHGWLAHGAVWTRPLAPGEIADLAVI